MLTVRFLHFYFYFFFSYISSEKPDKNIKKVIKVTERDISVSLEVISWSLQDDKYLLALVCIFLMISLSFTIDRSLLLVFSYFQHLSDFSISIFISIYFSLSLLFVFFFSSSKALYIIQ